MKKILLILSASFLLGGCTVKDMFVKASAGLEINASPTATVFLNGENKGETPYSNKNIKPGTYTLKLVPTSDPSLSTYETKLELISKTSTIISRTFMQSDLDSSGYSMQLQEDPSGGTYLSVISDPDNVNITIDDKPSGFTPLSKLATSPGTHLLLITSPGYLEQKLGVNTVKGYNLIVNFKLAGQTITLTPATPSSPSADSTALTTPGPSGSPIASGKPTPTPSPLVASTEKPYILIGETGTGWLRVRKEASGTSEELGKVDTGEKLKYLGESTELGWFKVEFEGNPGWVSGKYVTLVK